MVGDKFCLLIMIKIDLVDLMIMVYWIDYFE